MEAFILTLDGLYIKDNEINNYVYHSTKSIDDAKSILNNGFNEYNEHIVYLAEDIYDSRGYGNYTIAILKSDINKLNLKELYNVDKEETILNNLNIKNDGVKYNYPNHNIYYIIKNIKELNTFKKHFVIFYKD